ncbi:MAG: nuclease [Deltaproteobacteria bacterium]|jgi:micrococcal nuclease|nr:nuclease [Deltaproteobacteria bacterium]MBT6431943.1 nuclease [Deltaproteobacteria bacterium]MBT6491351.1 nuclease [Deltaproteobacteria bacterium]
MEFKVFTLSVALVFVFLIEGCQTIPVAQSTLKKPRQNAALVLDGKELDVYWDDGDTFEFREHGRKTRARLRGFNTLESYGPVHSWGQWKGRELYEVAFQATAHAKSEVWECTRHLGSGGYGRILVDCPKLRETLLSKGLAHVFWMNGAAPEEILKFQHQAIKEKIGMWSKGAPSWVLTSIHSASEDNLPNPYNRQVSTQTGEAMASTHSKRYQTCQNVCEQGSCMLYVPYRMRYGKNRAKCLISR